MVGTIWNLKATAVTGLRVEVVDISLCDGRIGSLLESQLSTVHHGAHGSEAVCTHVLTAVLDTWGGGRGKV